MPINSMYIIIPHCVLPAPAGGEAQQLYIKQLMQELELKKGHLNKLREETRSVEDRIKRLRDDDVDCARLTPGEHGGGACSSLLLRAQARHAHPHQQQLLLQFESHQVARTTALVSPDAVLSLKQPGPGPSYQPHSSTVCHTPQLHQLPLPLELHSACKRFAPQVAVRRSSATSLS